MLSSAESGSEAEPSDEEGGVSLDVDPFPDDVGCYTFNLDTSSLPIKPTFGWYFGSGDWEKDRTTGQVNLLLPPPGHNGKVHPRHCCFTFDREGRFWLSSPSTRVAGSIVTSSPETLESAASERDPRAVILDMGLAIQQTPDGITPQDGSCGTTGFAAPELTMETMYGHYGNLVDVWSMGTVAYYVLEGDLPWYSGKNIWVPGTDDEKWLTFCRVCSEWRSEPEDSLRWLVANMLTEVPGMRWNTSQVLEHSAIKDIRASIDLDLAVDREVAGTKHDRPVQGVV